MEKNIILNTLTTALPRDNNYFLEELFLLSFKTNSFVVNNQRHLYAIMETFTYKKNYTMTVAMGTFKVTQQGHFFDS